MKAAAGLTLGLVLVVVVVQPAAARDVDAVLERAVAASDERPHTGTLVVSSFSTSGPQLTEVEVTRAVGDLRVVRGSAWEVGRAGGEAFLKRSGTLLRLGGIERVPFDLGRLRGKYELRLGRDHDLDTGPAARLEMRDRDTGALREVLYVDTATDLVVRRETFDLEGAPVRVVAFTQLEVADASVSPPDDEGLEVEQHAVTPADLVDLEHRGFVVPKQLTAGYELLGGYEVTDAAVPTLHLVYGDGLYTLSLFEQRGRLSLEAVRRAERLLTEDGGAVWRWPGSEPRRVIWAGDGLTFTALTDAPTDELLAVVADLPTDEPPSMLERLARGLSRVGRWLWPLDRSE